MLWRERSSCGRPMNAPAAFKLIVAILLIAGYLLLAVLGMARQRILLLVCSLGALAFAYATTTSRSTSWKFGACICVHPQGIIAIRTLLAIGWVVSWKMRPQAA